MKRNKQGFWRSPPVTERRSACRLAKSMGAEILNFHDVKVREALTEMTGGIGPDACIDAVGLESHGFTIDNVLDAVKATVKLGTDRPHVLREVILACRSGGRISVPGVYGALYRYNKGTGQLTVTRTR